MKPGRQHMHNSQSCHSPVKSENLKVRVLLPLSLALAILVGSFVTGVYLTEQRQIRSSLSREAALAGDYARLRLREDRENLSPVLETLEKDRRLAEASLAEETAASNKLILASAGLGLGVWSLLFVLFYTILNRADDRQRADLADREEAEERLRKSHDQLIDALRREKRISMSLEATMEQLKAATDVAKAATRAKSEFLANISHEIRTPMTAILGFAENLLDLSMPESERITAAQIIRNNGEHLLQILNDILDISKIEAGKLQIENIKCSPIDLVQEVMSLMRVRSDAKGLSLRTEYAGPVPVTIHTDSTRLRQILINLVGNAVKFTEIGSVRLVVGTSRTQADRPMMVFDIIDTGVGLTQEQIDRLFHPFTQGDSSTTRTHGGTGLGLTISKRLAEMLGGAITVHSQPGLGSTFRLTVETGPLDGVPMIEQPEAAQSADQHKHGGSPKDLRLSVSILLAEDGPDNQRLISYMLKKAGADVAVADNGQDAVTMVLEAHHRNMPYALVLMDMQMPVMDGYEASRQLRAHGYEGPIIALTAHAMTGDRDKCLSAGCSDYAAKPIDRATLMRLIQQHLAPTPCTV